MELKDKDRGQFDEGWKEIMELYFPQLMEFFFPDIYQDIDFNKGYEFLDTELNKIVKDSTQGKRHADKLVKVALRNGQETWLLIHVDVQGYYDLEFAKRMYTYNYRIYDRYGTEVVSLAILADESKNFRPSRYEVCHWGFRYLFEFPIVKLLDYLDQWSSLEKSKNPFAIVVMAHLKGLQLQKGTDERLFWKIRLVKMMYEGGYSKEDILNLYRFIEWVISLPKDLKLKFHEEIIRYEEEKKMPFITTAESIGLEKGLKKGREEGIKEGREEGLQKGREEGLQKGREEGLREGMILGLREAIDSVLKVKFGPEGVMLMPEIGKIHEVERLRSIKEAIEIAKDLEEIKKVLKN